MPSNCATSDILSNQLRTYGQSSRVKTLVIDGRDVSARETETILEAAQEQEIFIPTLCPLEGLSEVGACRLCLVEVKGVNKLLPVCVTRVEEG